MNAKLTNIYVDESTIVKGDKINSTKRLVFELGNKRFMVVKVFSLDQQDVDFNKDYTSVKLWKGASIEDVAQHWNTKLVKDPKEYMSMDIIKFVVDTAKEFLPDLEADTSHSGYLI